jgi:MFS family permease
MVKLTKNEFSRNLYLNCFHEFSWGFGLAFHTTYAIIPLFLKKLGAPDSVIISVAGLFSILIAFPMFFSAIISRNIRNIKKAVFISHLFALPPMFFAGFIFAFLTPTGPNAWMYYYACFILYCLSLGFIIPIWADFLSHIFPRKSRGHYLGISFAFNSVGGFFGGIIVKTLLNSSVPFPNNFGWGFIIMGVSMGLGVFIYLFYNVENKLENTPHKTIADFWYDTKTIIKTHENFKRYLFSRIFITAHFPAMSLYAVYTQELFGFKVSSAGIFIVLQVITFGLGSILSGKFGDRWGHKTAITVSFSGYLLAIIFTIFATSMIHVYAIFLALGLGHGGFMPSAMNMVYEFAESRDSKTYMALIDTFLAPFVLLMVVGASLLNPIIGTRNLFILSGMLIAIGLLLLTFWVKEPRLHPHKMIS